MSVPIFLRPLGSTVENGRVTPILFLFSSPRHQERQLRPLPPLRPGLEDQEIQDDGGDRKARRGHHLPAGDQVLLDFKHRLRE